MALLVQKYGGSSVADAACMRRVAQRVRAARDEGHRVVVVVSAMGDTTDELIRLAHEINPEPPDREMDMLMSTGEQISVAILAMALEAIGVRAVSMTGPQAGIMTDQAHMRAKITDINPSRVLAALDDARVVIVAGFQGLTPSADISTLGRGGSDTTAVALAGALAADRCQIFTDVDGVYTADPRIVPTARKLGEIAYDEMLELANLGAKVLQSRSVEYAKKFGVRIEVLSSFGEEPGTLIKEEIANMETIVVRGIALDKDEAKVTVHRVPDRPGVAAALFRELAAVGVNVDMIVQNVGSEHHTDISFTVTAADLTRARRVVQAHLTECGGEGLTVDECVAKVSIVGVGMRSHAGVAHRMFAALAENGINIEMISTSEIKISVMIHRDRADEAMRLLHAAFGLDQEVKA